MKPSKRSVHDEAQIAKALRREITPRSREIIATIHRYRVIPASMLVRIIAGDPRVTKDHLTVLTRRGLINRFTFSKYDLSEEFNYYLDNTEALKLLEQHGVNKASLDYKHVRRNKKKFITGSENIGRISHLRHELMISRLRFMLEQGSRESAEPVTLTRFMQGAALNQSVIVPKLRARRRDDTWIWEESDQEEEIPWYPDALFSLYFHRLDLEMSFLWESDRQTMEPARMRKKYRAHFHGIVKRKLHRQCFGVRNIRAVITETLNMEYAQLLRSQIATHPIVCGPKPSNLFWFVPSEVFTRPITKQRLTAQGIGDYRVPKFLDQPRIIFDRIFASAFSQPARHDTFFFTPRPTHVCFATSTNNSTAKSSTAHLGVSFANDARKNSL